MKSGFDVKPNQCARRKRFFDWHKEYCDNKGVLSIYECVAGVGEWELDLCSDCQKSLLDWLDNYREEE